MAEHIFTNQNNVIWGETFKMSKKVPAIANRIFQTLADAQEYIDNLKDNAIDGIRISIINDDKTENNGVYWVEKIGDGTNTGVLRKIGGSVNWYKGNLVSNENNEFNNEIPAIEGDCYINTETLDLFILKQNDGFLVWKKIGNMNIGEMTITYALSTTNIQPPEDKWETQTPTLEKQEEYIKNNSSTYKGQLFLWTKFAQGETTKYTVALIFSDLDLGTFDLIENN